MSNITEALEFMKNEKVSIPDANNSIQSLCSDIITVHAVTWTYRCPRNKTDDFAYFAFYFDDNGKFHCYSNANIDVAKMQSYDFSTIARKVSRLRYKERRCGEAEAAALNRFFGREIFEYLDPTSSTGWYRDLINIKSNIFKYDENGNEISVIYYAGSKERDMVP